MSTLAEDHPTATKPGRGRALVMRFHVSEVEEHARIIGQACILKTPFCRSREDVGKQAGLQVGQIARPGVVLPVGSPVAELQGQS